MKKIIIIGGSAGSFKIITGILNSLPENFRHPVVLCLHRLRNVRSGFVEALRLNSRLEIFEPDDKGHIQNGKIYLAPANYHLLFDQGPCFSLSVHDPLNHSRPSIDIVMDSAAEFFREKAIGVILSGANRDGAQGLYKIHNLGGFTVVQDPIDSQISTMPRSCIELFQPDYIINADKIINFLSNL